MTMGCVGPNFFSYYYTSLVNNELFSIFATLHPLYDTMLFIDISKYEDRYEDEALLTLLGNPPYSFPGDINFGLREPSLTISGVGTGAALEEELVICNTFLKQKHISKTFEDISYNKVGNYYQFYTTVSLLKQLKEHYIGRNLWDIFNTESIPVDTYRSREDFQYRVNQITPSIFYMLLEEQNYDLLDGIVGLSSIITNRGSILSYDNKVNIWNYFDDPGTYHSVTVNPLCVFASAITGELLPILPNPTYRINFNSLYPDQRLISFFNHFRPSNMDFTPHITIQECERLIDTTIFPEFDEYEELFFNDTLENTANFFLSHFNDTKELGEFDFKDDHFEPLSKQYLVIQVMKEKYFIPKLLLYAINDYASFACSSLPSPILNFLLLPIPPCPYHRDLILALFSYFIRQDPVYWYELLIDDEAWPDNIDNRKLVSSLLKNTIDSYINLQSSGKLYNTLGPIQGIAMQLIFNFFTYFNDKTSLEWVGLIGYDKNEATLFCTEEDPQAFRYGMGLPKTECLMYMNALEFYPDFRSVFFNGTSTHGDIITYFNEEIFSMGITDIESELHIMKTLGVDTNEISMENIIPQPQLTPPP
jgi:hypothetical protein